MGLPDMTALRNGATFVEGSAPFSYRGEDFQTYYKLFGSLDSSKRPLVALHGGPGMSHDYLLPISDLSLEPFCRPVLFYDQIGSGRSTHLREKPNDFFTVQLFVDELSNILSHFKITEYDILGHSWGGMLAAEHALALRPTGLKSIIFSDSATATKLLAQSSMQLLSTLPDAAEVGAGMAAGFGDPVKYRSALEKFHASFGCIIEPVPKELTFSALDQMFGDKETGEGGDPTVHINMFTGALSDWSIEDRLSAIDVPVLVINGAKDYAQDFVIGAYFWRVKKAKWVIFERSSHVPMWEERDRYNKLVREWLEVV